LPERLIDHRRFGMRHHRFYFCAKHTLVKTHGFGARPSKNR
jgi:hypothetical protein